MPLLRQLAILIGIDLAGTACAEARRRGRCDSGRWVLADGRSAKKLTVRIPTQATGMRASCSTPSWAKGRVRGKSLHRGADDPAKTTAGLAGPGRGHVHEHGQACGECYRPVLNELTDRSVDFRHDANVGPREAIAVFAPATRNGTIRGNGPPADKPMVAWPPACVKASFLSEPCLRR